MFILFIYFQKKKDLNFGSSDHIGDYLTHTSIRIALVSMLIAWLIVPRVHYPSHLMCDDTSVGKPLFNILKSQVRSYRNSSTCSNIRRKSDVSLVVRVCEKCLKAQEKQNLLLLSCYITLSPFN
jgi:hypothetical protein